MNVQFYDAGGGMTVIMAEAMVSWQPPRPASEVIPASVTEVTIAAPGPLPGRSGAGHDHVGAGRAAARGARQRAAAVDGGQ